MKKRKLSKNRLEEREATVKKPKKLSNLIFVGIILFVMVFSILAIKLSDNSEEKQELEYNGFKLFNKGNGWVINVNNIEYGFEYSPQDVEDIKSFDLKNELFSTKVYVLFDPDNFSSNSLELLRLRQFLLTRTDSVNFACTKEQGCEDLPILDCRNPNKLVYVKIGEKTQIYKEDNCIVLQAINKEQLMIINRFMYGVLGVINDS